MTASTMVLEYSYAVMRRFVWIYASVQFALVVLFAHIFYSVLKGLVSFWFSQYRSRLLRSIRTKLDINVHPFSQYRTRILRRLEQQLNQAQTPPQPLDPTSSLHHSNAL
ncbi:hypothetical protein ARALYDRAFT_901340 [Arabidopsis lyrata subsp. lyrata]|uniref:Uncharacterized protein n=1 Tax=Arabidopsis lyrata subsp. lyrata TaxID=81972 RepID=D7LCT2_ARALL|nr:hypothetical protein ARALYDRAFT_901340 [Arabidopsis lyrata subsp. lyrata]